MMLRVAIYIRQTGTEPELIYSLRRTIEHHGDTVVAIYADNGRLTGRGKYAEWRRLLADLNAVDQVALTHAGDIPGKTVADLLKILAILRDHRVILAILRDHRVGLYLHDEQIDTASSGFALLDLIRAYRRAKLSQAIRGGQAKAVAAGKRIGRCRVASQAVSKLL
jgi:DNA invertase Pin-like site-specific DNA recombinase